MIELVESSTADDLTAFRRAYFGSLAAPLDGMWETFAAMGSQIELHLEKKRVGYASINAEGQVLQFFVAPPAESSAPELFAAVTGRTGVKGALVSTADPLFLGLCLDAQKTVRVHTYLYRDQNRDRVSLKGSFETSFDVVDATELNKVAELQRNSLDWDPGEWLVGHLEHLIGRRELYALRREGEILGTGETRVSETQPPFVDLGVITVRPHRGEGIATHILGQLKQRCYERGLEPICSTTVENIGSRRAITKAGFVSRHRLLEIGF